MKIAFFANNLLPLHANILKEKALGGTETGVVRLAEKLHQLGHEVTVFTNNKNIPESQPRYLPLKEIEAQGPVDVFVSIRDWIPIFYKIEAKQRFFWTGDSFDQFANFGLGDRRVSRAIDAFLCVSQWQADKICENSGFPSEKVKVIKNGIEAEYFKGEETRHPKRLIYSSTPYRGLAHIPRYFPVLKEKHPDLELHIYSSYSIYGQSDEQFAPLRTALEKLPDCHIHPNCLQSELAREFMKSSILFYPCHFEETSCITAMEAMAGGSVVLSSALGALPETCAEAGVLVEGLPGEPAYDQAFLKAADRLLSDQDIFMKQQKLGFQQSQSLSWEKTAERFISAL